MNFQAYADNVVIMLEPLPTQTESGIALAHDGKARAHGHRTARVMSSGPGHYFERTGVLKPNETKAGDRVVVEALCGDPVRYTRNQEFEELLGERGEFRVIREEEILAIIEGT